MENRKSPLQSPLKNLKSRLKSTLKKKKNSPLKSPLKNPNSPSSSHLRIPKSPYKSVSNIEFKGFNDGNSRSGHFDYHDDSTSVETDPKWGRQLDFEGEPIYTPELEMYPDRKYSSADAVFSNTDCEEEDWLDKLGPFSSEFLFLWVLVGID